MLSIEALGFQNKMNSSFKQSTKMRFYKTSPFHQNRICFKHFTRQPQNEFYTAMMKFFP